MKVTVADLGIGNIHSLSKALERCGARVDVTSKPPAWLDARVLVLPGVGSFGAGMRSLSPVATALRSKLEGGTPALGVCLGLQLLMERSGEDPVDGVGFVKGDVERFPVSSGKIPHMGWSRVHVEKDPLFEGIAADA